MKRLALVIALVLLPVLAGCAGSGSDGTTGTSAVTDRAPIDSSRGADTGFVADIRPAVAAVEAELGPGQQYFEVTASAAVTNIFVAVDDATAAIPYAYLDGELQAPAPKLTGASGFTFTAAAIDFDEDTILGPLTDQLPDTSIDTLSVEGSEGGSVRYVVATLSPGGGSLDVTVGPDGTVLEVDPN